MATTNNATIPNLEAATAVTQLSPATYSAHFSEHWCIGSVPHGGYVTATIQRAVALHFATTLKARDQPHMLSLHLEFLRRTAAAPATIAIHHSKLGRQTSTVHVSLSQRDAAAAAESSAPREEVVGYIIMGNLARITGPTLATNWALRDPPPLPAPTTLANPRVDTDPNWEFAFDIPRPTFRKATARVRWLFPRPRPAAALAPRADHSFVQDMWMGLDTRTPAGAHERWTTDRLGLAVDMFPQLVELLQEPGAYAQQEGATHRASQGFWYPTLLLNLDVRQMLPAAGVEWLFLRLASKAVTAGRYDLDVTVLDEQGRLVATSTHICFAVPAARNTSARGSFKGKI